MHVFLVTIITGVLVGLLLVYSPHTDVCFVLR